MGKIICGDALTELRKLTDNSVDSIVTDPPYELGFMGKHWDKSRIAYNVEMWKECLRVLKPGGHLLSFGGSRTYHRMACAIEDAGFEIRDQIMWIYGSGFPKSLDVSKAIDKMAGAKREVVGQKMRPDGKAMIDARPHGFDGCHEGYDRPWKHDRSAIELQASITSPATLAAQTWNGWGTALKPAHEPICVARKPLSEKTVAENVLRWGTGAINVDGCRIGAEQIITIRNGKSGIHGRFGIDNRVFKRINPPGRWPANVIHDGSDEVVGLFPNSVSSGGSGEKSRGALGKRVFGKYALEKHGSNAGGLGDSGSAARFFYSAKAPASERWFYCRDCHDSFPMSVKENHGHNHIGQDGKQTWQHINSHPTQKPLALMRYLVRLVTPPHGLVLDPFMGSGTTGITCKTEGFEFIGIEIDKEYCEIAKKRIYGELISSNLRPPLFSPD